MINLRPLGEIVAFPFSQPEAIHLAQAQLRNVLAALAHRHGAEQARALFTEAAAAELANQAHQTGNLHAARFAVEVLIDQAFAREAAAAVPVGYAG